MVKSNPESLLDFLFVNSYQGYIIQRRRSCISTLGSFVKVSVSSVALDFKIQELVGFDFHNFSAGSKKSWVLSRAFVFLKRWRVEDMTFCATKTSSKFSCFNLVFGPLSKKFLYDCDQWNCIVPEDQLSHPWKLRAATTSSTRHMMPDITYQNAHGLVASVFQRLLHVSPCLITSVTKPICQSTKAILLIESRSLRSFPFHLWFTVNICTLVCVQKSLHFSCNKHRCMSWMVS